MKKTLLQFIFNFLIGLTLNSQSNTIELNPAFQKNQSTYLTEQIPFKVSFEELEFVRLSCYHFDEKDIAISYRLKRNEAWSEWIEFSPQVEFVELNRVAYGTKPIMHSFDHIQLKTEKELNTDIKLRFFLASKSELTPLINTRSINCEQPIPCERDCWCPSCPIDSTPQLTEPTHLIVHHSGANNESENFAMVVESIWDFHVNTNGWDDIGYNWLIDPNGVLYQGRPDNYQGAHFSCINENTVGICVIGDYSLVAPSDEALSTLVNILAHEASEHNINVEQESYHLTGDFELTTIAGHRDSSGSLNACSGTECPGDSFYPLLPQIRDQVSQLECYQNVISTSFNLIDSGVVTFPNPFSDQLFIKSNSGNAQAFQLVNIYGSSMGLVYEGQENDLSYLSPGVYFLTSEGKIINSLIKL